MTIRRNLGGEVRAAKSEDGHHTIELRAITPGVVDDYGSVWMADCFDEALGQRLPVLAWSHDWSDPIGVGISFTPDAGGPLVTCRFDDFDAVPRAKQAFAQTSADPPTIRDCSVGFSAVTRHEPSEDELAMWPGAREVITKARMDELSLVLAGAVPGATVVGVRDLVGSGIRMAKAEDALISREAAGALIAKTATGELTLSEALNALNALNALETIEDGDDDGTDAPEVGAETDAGGPASEGAGEAGDDEGEGPTGGEADGAELTELDADIEAALELVGQ